MTMTAIDTGIFVNVEFERKVLQLAALTGAGDIHALVEAFNRWCVSTVFPWQVALDYCIDRAREGKSLPWEVKK